VVWFWVKRSKVKVRVILWLGLTLMSNDLKVFKLFIKNDLGMSYTDMVLGLEVKGQR